MSYIRRGLGATYHFDAAQGQYVDENGQPDPVTVASAAGFNRQFNQGPAVAQQTPGTVQLGPNGYTSTPDANGVTLLPEGIYQQQAEQCWKYTDNLAEQYACTLRNAALQDKIFATPFNGRVGRWKLEGGRVSYNSSRSGRKSNAAPAPRSASPIVVSSNGVAPSVNSNILPQGFSVASIPWWGWAAAAGVLLFMGGPNGHR
jgi:hypothetical protein